MDKLKKENYIKELKRKFKFNRKALNLFIEHIQNFELRKLCY